MTTRQLFLNLTPERVLAAVEAAGLECTGLCYPLNSFENRVYEVELNDRSRVVAKFYRPGRWREEQILEEHRFLSELSAEEIPVCPVRPFPGGDTLRRIDGIFYSLADRRGGRAPDELTDGPVARLGRLVARLHNVGARRGANRPRLDADHYVRRTLGWLEEHGGGLEGTVKTRYFDAAKALAEIADERMEGVPVLRIHGDLHLGNVLLRDGALHVLDFDDMVLGPAVQDLWLALPGRDAETRRQREIFLAAYEEFRLFDRSTLPLVEILRGLRMVRYAGWLARRWHDPAFRTGFPQFADPDYWPRETSDLEQHLAEVRRARHATTAGTGTEAGAVYLGENEQVLTNKDYFWDWEGD
jgi:Ser/Thr protein kinase RdoA (MazF antagonist)